jgi:nucleoside-diphosphate-sugar epimerase
MNMVQAGVGNSQRLLVTGAGGFLGHHLVKYPLANGYWVRSADIRRPEFEPSPAQGSKSSICASPTPASR